MELTRDVRRAESLIIRKRLTVVVTGQPGNRCRAGSGGEVAARQMDAALMDAGFKLSAGLLSRLAGFNAGDVIDLAVRVLAVVKEMAGDHVRHNVYFKDFPRNVPDTQEFWAECVAKALLAGAKVSRGFVVTTGDTGISQVLPDPGDGDPAKVFGLVNLLALPGYGVPQHSYEEMLAAHDALIHAASDRVTVLHPGGSLDDEALALYLSFAGSAVPLSDDDRKALEFLAVFCADGPQPEEIPVRENRALISVARIRAGKRPLPGTVTDVLRIAVALSGGDVTLQERSPFVSLPRAQRRILLSALHDTVDADRGRLGDIGQYAEPWKRLGERLHPHEHPEFPAAADAFAVARGEIAARSRASRVEAAFAAGDIAEATRLLSAAPGTLARSLDRLLRYAPNARDLVAVTYAFDAAVPQVSGRVLLSVREHITNRGRRSDAGRVFANRKGRASVVADNRDPFPKSVTNQITQAVDAEILRRLNGFGHVLVEPAILGVALPLSGKAAPGGFGMMPRGSVSLIEGERLRFFTHWMQASQRTDFDLSALLLDDLYRNADYVSWTSYHAGGYATYGGDMTNGPAPDGADEYIDVILPKVQKRFIIPQVLIYSGEGFDECAEAFFGFMLRSEAQRGAPFEARTVRMKSDLRGTGRVALPLVFMRGDDGKWRAKWLHLYLRGTAVYNTVENRGAALTTLTRAIVERDYLRVGYLTGLLGSRDDCEVTVWDGIVPDGPVTFIGLERPEGLAEGSRVITLQNLGDIIPE